MTYRFANEIGPTPFVDIAGSDQKFGIHRIYCVGQNYADHSREMGGDPDRNPPFFFTKPASAIVSDGSEIAYPSQTANLHHEIELVVAIGKGGADIARENAHAHIFGYAVGVDLTRRDIQAEAKKMGRPWDMAKGFDQSAPCSAITITTQTGHPDAGRIWLSINGQDRQNGDLAHMIWPVADIIAILSQYVALRPGDLIFTGTPAGVGPVERGDTISGGVDGVGTLSVKIV